MASRYQQAFRRGRFSVLTDMGDYEFDDRECPECGHSPTHRRECDSGCSNGLIDLYEEDPINFAPMEEFEDCSECRGAGVHWWCPACASNLALRQLLIEQI